MGVGDLEIVDDGEWLDLKPQFARRVSIDDPAIVTCAIRAAAAAALTLGGSIRVDLRPAWLPLQWAVD